MMNPSHRYYHPDMSSGKDKLSRPKCDNCGKRIYRIYNPYRIYGPMPSYCPRCGKKISFAKKNQLIEHEALIWLLGCVTFITIIIVIWVVF